VNKHVIRTLVTLVLASLLLPLSGSTSASAAGATKPTLSAATLTGSQSVTLTGTQTATVTVQMRIVSPDGDVVDNACEYGCPVYQHPPAVVLSRGLSTWPSYMRPMTLISGDRRDGVWQAKITMSANDAPSITIDEVVVTIENSSTFLLEDFSYPGADVFTNPRITVNGINPPVMEVTTSPADARGTFTGSVTATIRLVLRDSRQVLTGRPVYWCSEPPICRGLTGGTLRTTDSSGRVSFTFPRYGYPEAFFYRVNSGPAKDDVMYAAVYMGIPERYSLSASASPTSITLGQSVTLQGNVGNKAAVGNRVVVQRWVGGAWSNLGSANVRTSGRWSIVTRPQGKGTQVYRAWKPSDGCLGGRCAYRGLISGSIPVAVT